MIIKEGHSGCLYSGRNHFQDPVFNLFEKLYKYLEKSGFCPADLCAVVADDGGI